jgi:hypothetical protein
MGMCADVVAWGPFSPDIADYLEYPPDFYRSTKSGALVIRVLFGIVEGSTTGHRFAALLGISVVVPETHRRRRLRSGSGCAARAQGPRVSVHFSPEWVRSPVAGELSRISAALEGLL